MRWPLSLTKTPHAYEPCQEPAVVTTVCYVCGARKGNKIHKKVTRG